MGFSQSLFHCSTIEALLAVFNDHVLAGLDSLAPLYMKALSPVVGLVESKPALLRCRALEVLAPSKANVHHKHYIISEHAPLDQ